MPCVNRQVAETMIFIPAGIVLKVGNFNEDLITFVQGAGRLLVSAETQRFSGPKKMLSFLPIFILFRLYFLPELLELYSIYRHIGTKPSLPLDTLQVCLNCLLYYNKS